MQAVEAAYKSLVEQIKSRKPRATTCTDVLRVMAEKPEKIWWCSWELCGGKLSHRGSARASDLAIYHPQLVEDRDLPRRAKAYRLRLENPKARKMIEKLVNNK